jgi:hypothetical protein
MSSWPPVLEQPLHELQVPPPTGLRHYPSMVVVALGGELGAVLRAVRRSRRWAIVIRPGARLPIEAAVRHPRRRARPPLSIAPEVLHAKSPPSDVEVLRAATSRCSHAHQGRRPPSPPPSEAARPSCSTQSRHRHSTLRSSVLPRRGARLPIKAACIARRGRPRLRGRCRHGCQELLPRRLACSPTVAAPVVGTLMASRAFCAALLEMRIYTAIAYTVYARQMPFCRRRGWSGANDGMRKGRQSAHATASWGPPGRVTGGITKLAERRSGEL